MAIITEIIESVIENVNENVIENVNEIVNENVIESVIENVNESVIENVNESVIENEQIENVNESVIENEQIENVNVVANEQIVNDSVIINIGPVDDSYITEAKRSGRKFKENDDLIMFFGKEKEYNSNIYEKETTKIVCSNQINIIETEIENINENEIKSVEYCEDGTIIRLYNYKNEWLTATTKCINGKESYWSSNKSFDEMFWEIMDINNLYKFDTEFTYIFVLKHVENRLVIPHVQNELVYLSKINNETLTIIPSTISQFKEFDFVSYPEIINEFDINKFKNDGYFDITKRGIIIKSKDDKMYKIDFDLYKSIKQLRGNTPNIMYRYIELLNEPEQLYRLEMYYKEYTLQFDFVRQSLNKLIQDVYKLYVDSHIKHKIQIKEDNLYFRTLKQLHGQYKTTKKSITIDDVYNKINSLNSVVIYKLLGWRILINKTK